MLTPIAKSWPSQWCLEANGLAIQVLGGYGYTRDYPVEQHYRDNRLNPIHEGTHGIQALDLLGRKVVMDGGAGLALLADDDRRHGRAGPRRPAARRPSSPSAGAPRATGSPRPPGGCGPTAIPSSRWPTPRAYLEAVGHVVVAWMWLEQVLALPPEGAGDAFHDGKRQAARYFFRYELPRTGPQFDLLDEPGPDHAGHAAGLVLIGPAARHRRRDWWLMACRPLTTPQMITITSAITPMMISQRTASRNNPSRIRMPATTPMTQSSARMSTSRDRPRLVRPAPASRSPSGRHHA